MEQAGGSQSNQTDVLLMSRLRARELGCTPMNKARESQCKLLRALLFVSGWLMGLEPTTPRSTIWCSNQLSYSHRVGYV